MGEEPVEPAPLSKVTGAIMCAVGCGGLGVKSVAPWYRCPGVDPALLDPVPATVGPNSVKGKPEVGCCCQVAMCDGSGGGVVLCCIIAPRPLPNPSGLVVVGDIPMLIAPTDPRRIMAR